MKKKHHKCTPEEAIKQIARQNGVSVEEVRFQITQAIRMGMLNSDPQAREFWMQFSDEEELPAPEAVIAFAANEAEKKSAKLNNE